MGHSNDLAQKIYFHNLVQAKWGWHISKVFSGKMSSLKIKHLKKIHFLVPEYGNLTGVKTHYDRLQNSGEVILGQKVRFLISEGVKDLIEDSDVVRSLPFHFSICFAHEASEIFSFLLLAALSGFHPRVIFLSIFILFHFFFFHFFFDYPIMHLTIQNSSRTSERLIKIFLLAEEKRQQPC